MAKDSSKKPHCACEGKCEQADKNEGMSRFIGIGLSFLMLIAGLILDHFHGNFFNDNVWVKPLWYFVAFLPVGIPVVIEALEGMMKKDYFNELTLMSIACIGAFCIGEYSEAVGVMLFYCIGETLQERAVGKATRDISRLLNIKAERARVIENGNVVIKKPEDVEIGETIEVHPGERVALDGHLETENAMFDTAALTGESVPREIDRGEEVLAGMIASSTTVRIKVSRHFANSALSRILDLVKNAQSKKAKSEVFIKKFARIYTPVVIILATLVVCLPYFISILVPSFHYVFSEWLYRALVFLVISCPCALVISVPLSYFAGIGVASRNGILFKGGNYLEAVRKINIVAFDKTGTLTTGSFGVDKVVADSLPSREFLAILATAESESNHPLAKALVTYAQSQGIPLLDVEKMNEIAGKGTHATIGGKEVVAGNLKLLREMQISYPDILNINPSTIVACAINGVFAGYVVMSDTPKTDAKTTVNHLHDIGVEDVVMLSGDRKEIVAKYADLFGIKKAYGELLPEDKASYVEKYSKSDDKHIAFVGDGLNDAPVLALSNVGIAMGGLGSDAAVESADIVIQTDKPSKVATAIKIGRYTHKIVVENIAGALIIKIAILTLSVVGYASLWAAVFADVGVTMLAVLNSMRVFWKKY